MSPSRDLFLKGPLNHNAGPANTDTTPPLLPPEIILIIIESIIPHDDIALPASHTSTKTLWSLSLASRFTSRVAVPLLLSHCLYIDSPLRLGRLLATLRLISSRTQDPGHLGAYLASRSVLPHMQSLYLSPYPYPTIQDTQVTSDIYDLFSILAPSLRRLVIDINLRSVYPEDDTLLVRPKLRQAFAKLTNVEEFCSVRDELFLLDFAIPVEVSHFKPPIWSLWPRLRILALYNPDLNDEFWAFVARMRNLRTFVATRADGLQEFDLKEELRRWWDTPSGQITITLVNTWLHEVEPLGQRKWAANDPVMVQHAFVPISYYGDEDVQETCQEWVKRNALRGNLGRLYGEPIYNQNIRES